MKDNKPKSGLGLIAAARAEQIFTHHHTVQNDSRYIKREIFQNAAVAIINRNQKFWPEDDIPVSVFTTIMQKGSKEALAHAAAFLAAEIDYLTYREVQGVWRGEPTIPAEIGAKQDNCAIAAHNEIQLLNLVAGYDYTSAEPILFQPEKYVNIAAAVNDATEQAVDPKTFKVAYFSPSRIPMYGLPDWFNQMKKGVRKEYPPMGRLAGIGKTSLMLESVDFEAAEKRLMRHLAMVERNVNDPKAFMTTIRNSEMLTAWRKEQGKLSTASLTKATDFLRDKGLIEPAANIFVITKKRENGTEHINLAQLLQDYHNTFRHIVVGSPLEFKLELKDELTPKLNEMKGAVSNLRMHSAVVSALNEFGMLAADLPKGLIEAVVNKVQIAHDEEMKIVGRMSNRVEELLQPMLQGAMRLDVYTAYFNAVMGVINDISIKYNSVGEVMVKVKAAMDKVYQELCTAPAKSPTTFKSKIQDTTDKDMPFGQWKIAQDNMADTALQLATSWLRHMEILGSDDKTILVTINGSQHNLASMLNDFHNDASFEPDETIAVQSVKREMNTWRRKAQEWEGKYNALNEQTNGLVDHYEDRLKTEDIDSHFVNAADNFEGILDKVKALIASNPIGDHFYIFMQDVQGQLEGYQRTVREWRERWSNKTPIPLTEAVKQAIQVEWDSYCTLDHMHKIESFGRWLEDKKILEPGSNSKYKTTVINYKKAYFELEAKYNLSVDTTLDAKLEDFIRKNTYFTDEVCETIWKAYRVYANGIERPAPPMQGRKAMRFQDWIAQRFVPVAIPTGNSKILAAIQGTFKNVWDDYVKGTPEVPVSLDDFLRFCVDMGYFRTIPELTKLVVAYVNPDETEMSCREAYEEYIANSASSSIGIHFYDYLVHRNLIDQQLSKEAVRVMPVHKVIGFMKETDMEDDDVVREFTNWTVNHRYSPPIKAPKKRKL